MKLIEPSNGYSARVRLELHASGKCFSLGQIGRDIFILERPTTLPGSEGEVRAYIDDNMQRWWATWEASDQPREVVRAQYREMDESHNEHATARADGVGGL